MPRQGRCSQPARPGAGGQHRFGGVDAAAVGRGRADAGAVADDGGHLGRGADLRPMAAGEVELRLHAALRTNEAAGRLEAADFVALQAELRKPAHDGVGVDHLVRDAGVGSGGDGAADEIRLVVHHPGAALAGHDQRAALRQQLDPGFPLDLAPDLVRALHQRHVHLAFAHRFAGDAAVAVGGAPGMRRIVAVDPDHALAAAGELQQAGAADRAQADDDRIEAAFVLHRHARRLYAPVRLVDAGCGQGRLPARARASTSGWQCLTTPPPTAPAPFWPPSPSDHQRKGLNLEEVCCSAWRPATPPRAWAATSAPPARP